MFEVQQREDAPAHPGGEPQENLKGEPQENLRSEALENLKSIVSGILRIPAEEITAESRISDLALVESIKLLRIAGKIERRFGIELDDDAVFWKDPLGDIAAEVVRLQQVQRLPEGEAGDE